MVPLCVVHPYFLNGVWSFHLQESLQKSSSIGSPRTVALQVLYTGCLGTASQGNPTPSINGHFVSFHIWLLTIVLSAAICVHAHYSINVFVFGGRCQEMITLSNMEALFLPFPRNWTKMTFSPRVNGFSFHHNFITSCFQYFWHMPLLLVWDGTYCVD